MPDEQDEIFGQDLPEGNLADAVLDAMNEAEDKIPTVKADEENEQPPVEDKPEDKGEEKSEVSDEQLRNAQSEHDKRRALFEKLESATEGYDSRIDSIIAATVNMGAGKQNESAAKKTETPPADDDSGQDVATKQDLRDFYADVKELMGQAVAAPQRTQALAELHDLAAKLKENDILTDENVKEAETFLNNLDSTKVSWPQAAKMYRRLVKGMASENILAKKDFAVVDMKAKKQADAKRAAQPSGQTSPPAVKETDDEKLIRTLHEVGGDPKALDNIFSA